MLLKEVKQYYCKTIRIMSGEFSEAELAEMSGQTLEEYRIDVAKVVERFKDADREHIELPWFLRSESSK